MWRILVIVVIVAAAVLGIIALARHLNYLDVNVCVRVKPWNCAGGSMRSTGGFLGGSMTYYWLYYDGTRKLSGEVCKRAVRVTEREYERAMYGDKER